MDDTRQQDLRVFEEWYGGCYNEGYTTKKEAEHCQSGIDANLKGSCGEVSYLSKVVDRYGNGKFWVYMKRVIDYNHPERRARGL